VNLVDAHYLAMYTIESNAYIENSSKLNGLSIRLCNPSTLLPEGSFGTYTQNDGTILSTVVINGVEWISENLKERKYRNGDWIHGFDGGVYTPIADFDWQLLEIGAMCYYNDDINNG